ncbi:Uncharacterised protein [Mycobacterium tuberculosis]|nr:Uncharacterised protein [Mycobacterium tuberculosis]CFH16085.1 Uncharacterised protein [Mycobacterium tuberculosis]CFH47357.1 Uncharacterised protein [Mycobacterium tuberculosis]CFV11145.1 Uncharacterised protein [Mycobacterium tuberculosis]CKN61036.1 Uncharacterised protein [Mycobacterium tuberculosis]
MAWVDWLNQPEVCAPTFPNPDTPPAPVLKKPEDGAVVEFPNPGDAGTLPPTMSTGPTPPMACRFRGMLSMVIAGVLRALMWRITLIASGSGCSGIENPGMVKASVPAVTPRVRVSGPPVGMLRPTGKRVRAGVE